MAVKSFKTIDEQKEAVIALSNKYPFVRMDYYGFPEDWIEKPFQV